MVPGGERLEWVGFSLSHWGRIGLRGLFHPWLLQYLGSILRPL